MVFSWKCFVQDVTCWSPLLTPWQTYDGQKRQQWLLFNSKHGHISNKTTGSSLIVAHLQDKLLGFLSMHVINCWYSTAIWHTILLHIIMQSYVIHILLVTHVVKKLANVPKEATVWGSWLDVSTAVQYAPGLLLLWAIEPWTTLLCSNIILLLLPACVANAMQHADMIVLHCVRLHSLTSRCLHMSIQSAILSFPFLLYARIDQSHGPAPSQQGKGHIKFALWFVSVMPLLFWHGNHNDAYTHIGTTLCYVRIPNANCTALCCRPHAE